MELLFGPIVEPSRDSKALWRSAGSTFGFVAPEEPFEEATVTLETGVPGPELVDCWGFDMGGLPPVRKGLFKFAVAGGVGSELATDARFV